MQQVCPDLYPHPSADLRPHGRPKPQHSQGFHEPCGLRLRPQKYVSAEAFVSNVAALPSSQAWLRLRHISQASHLRLTPAIMYQTAT